MSAIDHQDKPARECRPCDLLSLEERSALHRRSNWVGGWLVARTWLQILLLLGLAGSYPGVLTVVLVLVLLPGRQLGLAVLMHEAGHGSLFASDGLNKMVRFFH